MSHYVSTIILYISRWIYHLIWGILITIHWKNWNERSCSIFLFFCPAWWYINVQHDLRIYRRTTILQWWPVVKARGAAIPNIHKRDSLAAAAVTLYKYYWGGCWNGNEWNWKYTFGKRFFCHASGLQNFIGGGGEEETEQKTTHDEH